MEIPEKISGAVPPHSSEAEVSVLGAMLQDGTAVLRAQELLSAEDFYVPEHGELFPVMGELTRNSSPIDLVTVHTELARRGTLEGVGGDAGLMRILNAVPTTANVKAYIDIVREKSTLRKLISACSTISGECYRQQVPLPETLAKAEKAGQVVAAGNELPKSFLVCARGGKQTVYLSQFAPATLVKRAETDDGFSG